MSQIKNRSIIISTIILFIITVAIIWSLWSKKHSLEPVNQSSKEIYSTEVEKTSRFSTEKELHKIQIPIPKPRASDKLKGFPKEVAIEIQTILFGEVTAPVLLIKHVDNALDLEAQTAAIATKVKLSRSENGLDCLIWSERGRRAINVTSCKSINAAPVPNYNEKGQSPSYASITDYANAGIKRLDISSTDAGPRLIIESPWGKKCIPFGNFHGGDGRIIPNYRYAVLEKMINYVNPIGVVIVDIKDLALCGEIEYPKDLPCDHPLFVLDPKTNGFVVVDGNLKWTIVVDLNPLAMKTIESKK